MPARRAVERALRIFPRFDLGLAFVGARGQPDSASSVRCAVIALAQRRFVMEGLEIDLGGGFGTFVASNAGSSADVHPYSRGCALFAVTLGRLNDFVVQSELGTTFTRAGDSGALEYALAAGIRQRL